MANAGGDQNKWLGLLKWSMKYQNEVPTEENTPKMSEEDRAFLEKVMREGVIDEVERMTQILRILDGEHPTSVFPQESVPEEKATDEELEEYKEGLLDELITRVDQIDNANNFVNIQGLPILKKVMESNPNPALKALAAEVLSVVVQNNPKCQDAAMENGMIPTLCKLAQEGDVQCKTKALLAISCLVRGHANAEKAFLTSNDGGLQVLASFLKSNEVKLQRKSLFFLRYLVQQSKENAEAVQKQAFYIPTLIQLIGHDDVDLAEGSLEALIEFYAKGPEFAAAFSPYKDTIQTKIAERRQVIDALDSEEQKYTVEEQGLMKALEKLL